MNLTLDTILTVVGLIATLVLGYIGVKYTLKYRKKIEILFFKNTSISLFKTIVKNLDDIEITFQGKKIDENLILFKGTFFNNGNVDIDRSIIHKPLEIELPENYNWVRHKMIGFSDGLEIKAQMSEKKLVFEWELLKEGEYFTFDSLVEYKSIKEEDSIDIGKNLVRRIKINQRITDLKKVSKLNSIPRPSSVRMMLLVSLIFMLAISMTFLTSFGQLLFPSYEIVTEVKLESGKQLVSFRSYEDNKISLIDNSGVAVEEISKNELIPLLTGNIQTRKKDIDYSALIGLGVISILLFIVWIGLLVSDIKDRRLNKKLKEAASKYDDMGLEEEFKGTIFKLLLEE